jgi:hypothetical protein
MQEWLRDRIPKGKVSSAMMAHLKRELFHGVWDRLLDDEFVEACENGMVIDCLDGVKRRVFPRIFTYSADLPEK